MAFVMRKDKARDRVKATVPVRLDDAPSQTGSVRRAIVRFSSVEDYVAEITTLWTEAAETFLLIGRHLNQARDALPHGEFQRMVEERLPFDKSRAYQLRMVAQMVDARRVEEVDLPRSSATAFLFTSLDAEGIARAKKDGVLRPDIRRQEVVMWKRRLLGPPQNTQAITRARAALKARIRRMEEELVQAREELASLSREGPFIDDDPETEAAVNSNPDYA